MNKAKMTAEQAKQERRWAIENAMSTLQRAEAIKKDPSLMRGVRKAAGEMAKAVGVVKTPPKKKK